MPKHKPPPSDLKSSTKQPKVIFDWKDWLPYLDDLEGTEAQKRELIETLWSIVIAFIDLGCEVGSDHEPCGQNIDLTAALKAAVLELEDHKQKEEI